MTVEASSITVSNTQPMSQNTQSSSSKSPSESSFKEEMDKVTTQTKDEKNNDVNAKKDSNSDIEKSSNDKVKNEEKSEKNSTVDDTNDLNAQILLNDLKNLSYFDVNNMLINDIQAMKESNIFTDIKDWTISLGNNEQNVLKFSESDAQFFIKLTENNDISLNNITAQAQAMLNQGENPADVSQNFKVSQALLEALSQARQNNQPLRIDFDQNVSVILRINQNGAISANFIPGDKAVEQYLKNNIDLLKNTFEENNLPYSELSYSHSSKDQNRRRREQEQQGE